MILLILCAAIATGGAEDPPAATVSSVAIRSHNTRAMLAFYTEAFGVSFTQVDLTADLTIYEGDLGHVRLKMVPIREEADFSGFRVHQLGFTVPDLDKVIALAERHGGRLLEKRLPTDEDAPLAAIRDPDGNSIELFQQR